MIHAIVSPRITSITMLTLAYLMLFNTDGIAIRGTGHADNAGP